MIDSKMRVKKVVPAIVLLLLSIITPAIAAPSAPRDKPEKCSYNVSTWNTRLRKSARFEKVSHPYDSLKEDEIDKATGCTVCREDQVLIKVPPLQSFYVCYKYADKVREAFHELVGSNATIQSVRGYKVIRSKGPLDDQGNRTQFSNHSYGAAIDVNRELNGLYDNCYEFGPKCKLLHGGKWNPDVPGTLVEGGKIVETLRSIGFKWGGKIKGKQKDFMHFSFSGY